MVYCGKPSRSCEACRRTKTKCDRTHPACGQCTRTGRVCPGYRDLDSLLFRDETRRVVRKAQKTPPRRASPVASAEDQRTPGDVRGISLVPDRRDQSICLFFYEYATEVEGVYDYVSAVCSRPSSAKAASYLYDTIELIGLAHLSGVRYGTPCLSQTELDAYRKHSAVLRAVNSALRDEHLAIVDETLAVVIFLGLFETITCMKPKSLRMWTNHIHGATALIKARGLAQFETETGRRIFQHLLDYIQLDAMLRREPIPDGILEISQLPCAARTPREAAHQDLFRIFVDLARSRYMQAHQTADPETIVALIRTIDESLEQWAASLPDEYAFSTVPAAPGQGTLHGVYHRYSDVHTARLWNGYRMGRITNANNMVKQAALTGTAAAADDLRAAQDRQRQMSAELCASVPYHELQGPMTAIVGHCLLWLLYCVATSDNAPAVPRLWALRRMRDISMRTATMQGVQMVDALARQWEVTVWEREGEIDEESGEW